MMSINDMAIKQLEARKTGKRVVKCSRNDAKAQGYVAGSDRH